MPNPLLLKLSNYILLIGLCFTCFTSKADQSDPLSLNFYQTQTSLILQTLADHQQMNLVLEDNINNIQTIKLNNVNWHDALNIITQSAKLQYQIKGNLLIVHQQADPQLLFEQQLQQQKEAQLKLPLSYLSLPIKYADLTTLMTMISQQNLLSTRGKIFIDERTQRLIVQDIAPQLKQIQLLVSQLDHPVAQVHISAHIVMMNNDSANELGIKWGYTENSSQFINHINVNMGVANSSSNVGFNLAKLSGNLLNLELSALEAENQLEIIASPTLLTSHQHTASIKQGTEIPYEVSSGNNGATSIEFKQAVLGLEVTPRVLNNKQMELNLHITQNTTGRTIKRSEGGEALAIDTQEIKTQVLVNSGETLVLGGIFQQTHSLNKQGVPGISHLPVIGGLFKYEGQKLQKRELVIFIMPQLIDF